MDSPLCLRQLLSTFGSAVRVRVCVSANVIDVVCKCSWAEEVMVFNKRSVGQKCYYFHICSMYQDCKCSVFSFSDIMLNTVSNIQ